MENNAEEQEMNVNETQTEATTPETENLAGAETTDTAETASLDPTEKLQLELSDQKDKYLRLYSEFENFRRRTSKEKLEMIQSANEQLIKALLPVVDDFERAEKAFGSRKEEKEFEGFFLIQNKFKKTFDQYGVKVMELGPGSAFDADFQEAITQIPAGDELKGKVVDVVEKGYLLNDKVIRFAKVVVGS